MKEKLTFTLPQITKILQEVAQEEEGFNKVLTVALESIMRAERELHNSENKEVSNGYRWRKAFGHGKQLKLEVPRSHTEHFYPVLLSVLKDQALEPNQ